MRISFFVKLLGLVLVVVATGFYFSQEEDKIRYRTELITRGDISNTILAFGVLNPVELVDIGTQVSGKVEAVYVKVNDKVTKGQLLAVIDPSLLQTNLKRSRANLETAKASFDMAARDLERSRTLVEKGYIAKIELERAEQSYLNAKNSYQSAQIQVEEDEVNLGYTQLLSPIDGIVVAQLVTEGQTVQASFQTPNMFKIAGDLRKMKIAAAMPEGDISNIKVGQEVVFTVDAYPNREFTGKVSEVNLNPDTSYSTVTYSTTIEVENDDLTLLPGMTANLTIILSELEDVLRIPAAALRFTPPRETGNKLQRILNPMGARSSRSRDKRVHVEGADPVDTVYILQNGEPVPVDVTLGATDETYIEVKGDSIKEGDEIVLGVLPKGS